MPTSPDHPASYFDLHFAHEPSEAQDGETPNSNPPVPHCQIDISPQCPGIPESEIERVARQILTTKEAEVVISYGQEGHTFSKIGWKIGHDRGHVHRIYKKALMKIRIYTAANLVHQLLPRDNGCTVHPVSMKYSGFDGFAIARHDHWEQFKDMPSQQQINNYLWGHRNALNFEGNTNVSKTNAPLFIGGCRRGDSDWLLEQTYIVSDYAEACAWAILEGQEKIYHFRIKRNLVVPTLSLPIL